MTILPPSAWPASITRTTRNGVADRLRLRDVALTRALQPVSVETDAGNSTGR